MELTPDQKNTLIDALMDAFRDEAKLGLMLSRELGIELNALVQNADTYEETVWKLVNGIEAKGEPALSNLIIGASRRTPGNPLLQEFVFTTMPALLRSPIEPIDLATLDELISIFRDLDSIVPLVKSLYTLQDIKNQQIDLKAHKSKNYDFLPDPLDATQHSRLDTQQTNVYAISIYYLLDLLKDYPGEDPKAPNLLAFTRNLAEHPDIAPAIADRLRTWGEAVATKFNLDVADPIAEPEVLASSAAAVTDISLMIIISERTPPDPNDPYDCTLKACLQEYQTQGIKSTFVDKVDIDFGEASSETGKPCLFSKIEADIKPLIDKSAVFIYESFRHKTSPDFIIEVFVPLKWMLTEVDLWQTGDFQEEVGRLYPVVMRSYERNQAPQLRLLFAQAWQRVCEPVFAHEVTTSELAKHYVAHIKTASEFSEGRKFKEKVALKATCAPPARQAEQFLKCLIQERIPLAMWTRCNSLKSMEEKDWTGVLDGFFDWPSLSQRLVLLERIRQCREDACAGHLSQPKEDCLGYYLSVLSDDPNRVPEALPLDSHEELQE
jgi:hypothetical protein